MHLSCISCVIVSCCALFFHGTPPYYLLIVFVTHFHVFPWHGARQSLLWAQQYSEYFSFAAGKHLWVFVSVMFCLIGLCDIFVCACVWVLEYHVIVCHRVQSSCHVSVFELTSHFCIWIPNSPCAVVHKLSFCYYIMFCCPYHSFMHPTIWHDLCIGVYPLWAVRAIPKFRY